MCYNTVSHMEELKQNIAKKLIFYRKKHKLTQAELAEKISYSDKSISKWEREEALPDVAVLKMLADIYGITVEHFITPQEKQHIKFDTSFMQALKEKRLLVVLLSVSVVWFIATLLFVIFKLFMPYITQAWWCFIIAIPVTFIVTTIFCELWANKVIRAISASLLSWSTIIAFFLILALSNRWLIIIVAIPLQIIIILWFLLIGKLHTIKNQTFKTHSKK